MSTSQDTGKRWMTTKFYVLLVLLFAFALWFVVETFFPPPFRPMAY